MSEFLEDELNNLKDDQDDGGFLSDELSNIRGSTGTGQVEYQPEIHFHSSEDMHELDDESVHLAVTSPPYNADWDYGSHDDDLDYATEYLPMLANVFREVYRVLVPGGRFCINIPTLLRSGAAGGYPIAGHIETMMGATEIALMVDTNEFDETLTYNGEAPHAIFRKLRKECDWREREVIAWVKGFNTDGLAPNGSFPRPWGVLLNNMHEGILVFQKPGQREYDDMSDETIENSKIEKTSDDYCDDVWKIHPESWTFKYVEAEDVPVFPEEIPRRCIKLWSYEGDTILDPFAGRFTTGKVAKDLNRHSVGYELREDLEKDIQSYTNMAEIGLGAFQ